MGDVRGMRCHAQWSVIMSEDGAVCLPMQRTTPQPQERLDFQTPTNRERRQYSIPDQAHSTSPRPTLSILMCAYNEERTIARAVLQVLKTHFPCDIQLIVVDDGSTDMTPIRLDTVSDPRLVLHRHQTNRGKGASLLTAASLATGQFIIPFDADLEYLAEDIPRVLAPALSGHSEVVYGVRRFGNNTVYHSYRYAIGNRLLTHLANSLFGSHLSDLHTCLKLLPLEMFCSLNLKATGFGLDTELTASLLRLGIRPFEIPITYHGRSHAEGKKISWRDAISCLRILLRVRLSRPPQMMPVASEGPKLRSTAATLTDEPFRRIVNATAGKMSNDCDGVNSTASFEVG